MREYEYYSPVPPEADRIRPGRMLLLAGVMLAVLAAYTVVLYDTQVTHHQEYLAQSVRSIPRTETVKASRGVITDRNGVLLISNGFAYDLTFDPSLLTQGQEINAAIARLLNLCQERGVSWTELLPVTKEEPFALTVSAVSDEQKRRFFTFLCDLKETKAALGSYLQTHQDLVDTSGLLTPEQAQEEREQAEADFTLRDRLESAVKGGSGFTPSAPVINADRLLERFPAANLSSELLAEAGITADALLDVMARAMEVPEDFTPQERRQVLGVRYELQMRKLGDNTVYILAENIDTAFISLLSDGNFAGTQVLNSSVRQYETTSAAHILGTVKPLFKEDLENPLYENYPLDATIGANGVEAAFEEYLHGVDGRRVMAVSEEGRVTGEYYSRQPKPGSTVELTIDLEFQKQVEAALAETVEALNEEDGQTDRGAGVAVVRVGTGEILALASYPTFDITEYRTRYNELLEDPARPLNNKATSGLYAPGSTLKPATAIAALDTGTITLKSRIYDTGRWTYPRTNLYTNCWYLPGHGSQNVTMAITNSCNYFFAELGYRMGMDTLRQYYAAFGLGDHTGIETGDSAGNLPSNPQGQDQAPWAAYGQSNQRYTPLQLANYVATLVSGGKHYSAHLLKAVKSYDNTTLIAAGNTSLLNTIDINPDHLAAVKQGMKNYTTGSLARYFQDCVVDAGAKTGTAQIRKGVTNNGVFICFAPYDQPEIALGMVIEKGEKGANLASTAVKILNAWFTPDDAPATGEYELLP